MAPKRCDGHSACLTASPTRRRNARTLTIDATPCGVLTMEKEEPVLVLSAADLKTIARARLADAAALLAASRLDGSAYLCGYVVELALKARICRTLKWPAFPEKRNEFEGLQSFKTHDLDVLLRLSGREQYIKVTLFPEWTIVSQWNPEARYQMAGAVSVATARNMIFAAQKILAKV